MKETQFLSNITVVDALMGSGKTSLAIQMTHDHPEKRFLYVTPMLSEVERIKKNCHAFMDPQPRPTKHDDFKRLLESGKNIVTTHASFLRTTVEMAQLIRNQDYCVILDECINPLFVYRFRDENREAYDDENLYDMEAKEQKKTAAYMSLLLEEGIIRICDDDSVAWLRENEYKGTIYGEVARYAKAGNLYYFDKKYLTVQMPLEVFTLPKEMYILTYLFQGQDLRYFFNRFGIEYELAGVEQSNGTYEICPYDPASEDRRGKAQLISVFEPGPQAKRMVDYPKYQLSHHWFKDLRNSTKISSLKNNIHNFIRNIVGAGSSRVMWTSYKDAEKKLRGKGYIRSYSYDNNSRKAQPCFVPFNTRGTNDYSDRDVLVYAMNCFPPEYLVRHYECISPLTGERISFNRDLWAVSSLLQWVFRSAVRNGMPVQLYLPSERMRRLYSDWVEGNL